MKFETFLKAVPKIHNLPLPGRDVQFEMAPQERLRNLKKIDIDALKPRQAGVMALFYPDKNQNTYIILILRKTYKGVHSNQVGFPGGKVEETDKNLKYTALRETQEEVGIPIEAMEVFKKMTNIYIPPSNFWVQCYMGITRVQPRFIAQEDEVEALIEVPLSEFISNQSLVTKTISTSYMENAEVPSFQLQGYTVWGATAMMLNEVRALLITAIQG